MTAGFAGMMAGVCGNDGEPCARQRDLGFSNRRGEGSAKTRIMEVDNCLIVTWLTWAVVGGVKAVMRSVDASLRSP